VVERNYLIQSYTVRLILFLIFQARPFFFNFSDFFFSLLYCRMKKLMLQGTWRRIEPVARQLALAEGLGGGTGSTAADSSKSSVPSFSDFLWAYSIFWSRAISIPITNTITLEGIVPGLDFANHSENSKCRWTMSKFNISGASGGGGNISNISTTSNSPFIQLVCPRGSKIPPGNEITINYGNKSNEELLYLYGFAQEENKHDVLMVACPLPPPSDWDETLHARVQLLHARGLTPQVFLPAEHLLEASEVRKSRGRKRGRRPGDVLFENVSGGDEEEEVVGSVAELDLPNGVMETLEVFVMEKKDVLAELNREGEGGAAADRGSSGGQSSLSEIESSGLRLALLTTLVRLLELKIRELEGSEHGSGSLESDEKLLEQAKGSLNAQQRAALIYRSGQKRLARQYLLYGNALLQQEMRHLRALTA
jgi:hypothetical protein